MMRFAAAGLTLLLLCVSASANPLSAAWAVARMQSPWALAAHVAGAALGYGHQAFIIGAKSRAIKEMFDGIDEFKQCIWKSPESHWGWGRPKVRRDRSGCVIGPMRTAAAFYLIKTNMHQWIWPQIYMHEESKRSAGRAAGQVAGRVTRGMMKRIKSV